MQICPQTHANGLQSHKELPGTQQAAGWMGVEGGGNGNADQVNSASPQAKAQPVPLHCLETRPQASRVCEQPASNTFCDTTLSSLPKCCERRAPKISWTEGLMGAAVQIR